MSFDWNRYLVLADELRNPGGSAGMEARLRSSISRAYYALFNRAREQLAREGARFDKGTDIHQQIVQILRTSSNSTRVMMGAEIGKLRRLRNLADYDREIESVANLDAGALTLRESIQRRMRDSAIG